MDVKGKDPSAAPGPAQEGRLGEALIKKGLITKEQLAKALEKQKKEGSLLGQVLVELGYAKEDEVLGALGEQRAFFQRDSDLEKKREAGALPIKVSELEISPEVIASISPSIARIYMIIPISIAGNILTIATASPDDIRFLDDLRFMLNVEIEAVYSTVDEIKEAIERYYGQGEESVEDIFKQIEQGKEVGREEPDSEEVSVDDLRQIAREAPTVRLLDLILTRAIKERASDIHFEPFEDRFKVRYRIDGALYDTPSPPKHLGVGISSRIKVIAGLDIAERRIPQDGRIELKIGERKVDLRVSTLPTVFGESIVMRVLDRSMIMLSLNQLGMLPENLKVFEQLIQKPNGIILCTGPTGCGKTTTLYSALASLDSASTKIITTEDPVEYDIPGIVQVHIKEAIGLTFARCLRAILRQDPDTVLVGEIRDLETVQIAIQASLTGHLVFSTLHTNDAAATITRLLDMGIEPFLITSTLEAVIGQRLVRTICQNCKEPYQPDKNELLLVGLAMEEGRKRTFYRGKGCGLCSGIGYKGRAGIFELLIPDDNIRVLIMKRATAGDIRRAAGRQGMRTMREDGLEKIYQGITTISEVARETA
jgi:type IV pilus assembly protein PilB